MAFFPCINGSLQGVEVVVSSEPDDLSPRLWTMSDIVELVEVREANQGRKRGPYKKRNGNYIEYLTSPTG